MALNPVPRLVDLARVQGVLSDETKTLQGMDGKELNAFLIQLRERVNFIERLSRATASKTIFVVEVDFSFTDSSKLVASLTRGSTIVSVTLEVTYAFDSATQTISVGWEGNTQAVMQTDENQPSRLAEFYSEENITLDRDRDVKVYLNNNGTSGTGKVSLTYFK